MIDRDETEWKYPHIPVHTMDGIVRYVNMRIPTSGFLHSVLTNDLRSAVGGADEWNAFALVEIVRFLHNEAPAICWGSEERVNAWLKG